jgi:hypothetical protein
MVRLPTGLAHFGTKERCICVAEIVSESKLASVRTYTRIDA